MDEKCPDADIVVIGAGVVGMAIADALARAGRAPLVLERRDGVARETSSRNSQVVHGGLYYPPGSSKARLCVRGRRLLYEFCEHAGVEHRKTGKVIVAKSREELGELDALLDRGRQSGVEGLRIIGVHELSRLEPEVRGAGAIVSEETGIVDAHAFAKALQARARAHGAETLFDREVVGVEPLDSGQWRVSIDGPARETISAVGVVNAAGLGAVDIARFAGVSGYEYHFCKGDYFRVPARFAGLSSRLVYPLPSTKLTGLGVHYTLDLEGGALLGPDAIYVDGALDYDVDVTKEDAFREAAAELIPRIISASLEPDFSGIRPKLQGPGQPWRDFVIAHDLPGLINLIGIESPGLTSAMAMGDDVLSIVEKSGAFGT